MLRLPRIYASGFSTLLFVLTLSLRSASADVLLPAGFMSVDPGTGSGTLPGTFDIYNQTGTNSSTFPDTTFPIATSLALSDVSLTINFLAGGSVTETEEGGQFVSDGSGGFTGAFSIDLNAFPVSSAVLTGTFSPQTVTLNDGATVVTIEPAFTTDILPSSGGELQIGDLGIINVTETPEPGGLTTLAAGLSLLLAHRGGRRRKGIASAAKKSEYRPRFYY